MMRRVVSTLTLSLVMAACAPQSEPGSESVETAALHAAIDSLLAASAEAWNDGDLDAFLYWYRRSPETTYIGAGGLVHGWEGIRDRYAPLFEPGAARDSLRFEDLQTRSLGPGFALAVARYVLFEGDSVSATGLFTLVLRRTADGWRIVHDHSSAVTN